ncbi:uncharacterized protein [Asterias amurensis]|uniref:uncharacterized protein n=1 Tax=Asterias amurensis TaxID=7602 RepID=UPI003AB88BD9
MAASGLERDDGGLKIEPNFELLAILLALALQGEDAERFLEVYDNIVPKSLSVCEVDNLKEKSRELSELPGQTLLQLKFDQEKEAALFSSPSAPLAGGCLGRFVSRRIANSFHQQTKPELSSKGTGKFLSRSGALLSQRLNVQNKTASGVEQTRDYGGRINSGNQAGASYLGEHSKPRDFARLLNQDRSVLLADDDLSVVEATGDTKSSLMPNKWSTMESDIAGERKVLTGVKSQKTTSAARELVLMNGTAENVEDRTVTDRSKHCVKSKPPHAPTGEGAKTKTRNCFPKNTTVELHCDCNSDECTDEEKAALIPKSPPFNSLEDIGHSVGILLTNNSLPKNSTCPPPLFLSNKPTTHPNSMDSSMAANAETKYGSISCSDVNSDAAKFDEFLGNITNSESVLNHCMPDEKSANKKLLNDRLPNSDLTVSSSVPEVPKSCVNKSSADGSFEREESDFGCSEDQPQSIDTKWAAAKKKKKKSKKKKSTGTVNDTMNVNSTKLASPQSPPEHHTKHPLRDSGIRGEVTSPLPNELGRHPPIVSSDSVTSSGDSSTDGAACLNDVSSVGYSASRNQPDALFGKADLPVNDLDKNNTTQTSKPDCSFVGRRDKVQPNNNKGVKMLDDPVKLQHVDATSKTVKPSDTDNPVLSKVSSQPSQSVPPAKCFPSDSDSEKHDPQMQSLDTVTVSDCHQATTVGKPHSLSEPTVSADSSADNDNADFKEVKYKRSLRSAKKRGGVMDDHRYAATTGRYMDRESYRKNLLSAGLRKSSSEPTGMSQLGDKDSEDVDHNKLKPKNLSENLKKTDKVITPPIQTEPTTAPLFELSYASKVKSNMKASSLPLKLSPQVLLDFKDGDHVDSPSNSENSMESVTAIKSTASDSKALPSGITVLDLNNPINAEQSEAIAAAQSAKDFQSVKSNIRPDQKYIAAQTARSNRSSSAGQGSRTFQRSSSVDHNKVIKEVSFDDTCRRAVSPQGPEASVQYLNLESSGLTSLTYANCLKLTPIPKTAAASRQPPASNMPQAPMVALKDLKSQPLGVKTSEKEPLVTSKASIVLSTNPPSGHSATSKGNLPAAKKQVDRPDSSTDEKPINLRSRVQAPVPVPPRNTSSPTPSAGSSTSKPYPVFDLEPQGNCGVTFGSLIFDKGNFEILEEDNATLQKGKPAVEFTSKAQVHVPRPTTQGQGLSCAELERSIISQHSAPSSKIILDTTTSGGHTQPAGGVSFGKFDLGIAAALDRKNDTNGEFNHLEVAAMLLAEWRKTEVEINQNKVTVIGIDGAPN